MEITNELLTAYVEGSISAEEKNAVRQYLVEHPDKLDEILFLMDKDFDLFLDDENLASSVDLENLDARLDDLLDELDLEEETQDQSLPILALAAENIVDSLCAIRCEGLALRQFGFAVSDDDLIEESKVAGWLTTSGTALHNIGRLSGSRGLSVRRQFNCSLDDVRKALEKGSAVIAAVDGGELTGDVEEERQEDLIYGEKPDHAVVITSIDQNEISIQDSATPQKIDSYPLSRFVDAWNDSSNYMIEICDEEYVPRPIDLSDVELSDELLALSEAVAENAHEVWAYARKRDGWTYGPKRDDAKKQHPDMIAYDRLPDSEKVYDREMVMNTIKFLIKVGYSIK